MKNKSALHKLLGFIPKMKRPIKTKKLSEIPADPVPQVFDADKLKDMKIDYRLDVNMNALRTIMAGNSDFVLRKFNIGPGSRVHAAVAYMDGLVNVSELNRSVLNPLMTNTETSGSGPDGGVSFERVEESLLTASDVRVIDDYKQIFSGILYGDALVLVDGHNRGLLVSVKGFAVRSSSEPLTEGLVRGPREGFTESLRHNTAMVRRRLRSPNFILENMTIGRVSNTSVAIGYIRGLADPKTVNEVKNRLSRITIDGILESGYIEELIEDHPYSPFPQIHHTERPDRVAESLMVGRVAIFTDNTPFVLIVPGEFLSFLQTPEDYYERYFLANFVRIIRYLALSASLLLPSFYIAIVTFHQEMIPTQLLISVAASREGVPFPALVEAFLMEFTFEALREAGLRLPRPVGQAVSIVGALVVGEAAVAAGIVSSLMVIIVAVTGIASFVNPAFNMAITMRVLRFPMMLLAGSLGLFGVMAGLLVLLVHMAGLRSFGVPYLAPFAPFHKEGMRDTIIRAPWWGMNTRPVEINKDNPYRMAPDQKPGPWQDKLDSKDRDLYDNYPFKTGWRKESQNQYQIGIMQPEQHGGDSGDECESFAECEEAGRRKKRKRRQHRTHKKK
ncbi:MAG: spore germination protein [Desulfotomaculum sp.]|nr:spore germination protein [Desulfotomaculum sp.]